MDHNTLQELKSALEKERATLIAELKSIATPDPVMKGDWDAKFPQFEESQSSSHSLDEEADEVEEYEVRLAAEQSLETQLLMVEKALARIASGSYGICAKCGREIPLARMRANLSAEFDIEHA